jgi:glycosyltransferase involved in cell wall biosynthesis
LHDIHEAVNSVLHQTHRPHEVIVVVDHNEELFNQLKSELPPGVTLALNDGLHQGSSATDNVGISLAKGDIVAFIDDDGVAARDWLEKLIMNYQDAATVSVGGKIIPKWIAKRPSWFCDELNWVVGSTYKGHPESRTEVRNLIFCNASLRKNVFGSVGLLPAETGRLANWGTGFESQAFLRLKSQMPDARIIFDPAAIVYHKVAPHRAKIKYIILRSYNEGYFKAKVEKAVAGLSHKPLSTESSYLRYLLLSSIPRRLRYFYKPWYLAEASAIMIMTIATGLGYIVGKLGSKFSR